MNKNITIVTGLWDIGRGQLDGWSKRDFNTYKEKFFELLKTDNQLCIFIDESLKQEVEEIRKARGTLREVFCHRKTLFVGRGELRCHGQNHGDFISGIVAYRALHV
jgi:hypothetical protein